MNQTVFLLVDTISVQLKEKKLTLPFCKVKFLILEFQILDKFQNLPKFEHLAKLLVKHKSLQWFKISHVPEMIIIHVSC